VFSNEPASSVIAAWEFSGFDETIASDEDNDDARTAYFSTTVRIAFLRLVDSDGDDSEEGSDFLKSTIRCRVLLP